MFSNMKWSRGKAGGGVSPHGSILRVPLRSTPAPPCRCRSPPLPFSTLASRWTSLHRLSPWFEEAYLTFALLVEARFLAKQSCLLSESFYGLRRCRYGLSKGLAPAPSSPAEDAHEEFERNGAGYGTGQRLRARERRKALVVATLLPYLFAKLDSGHERGVESATFSSRLGRDDPYMDNDWKGAVHAASRVHDYNQSSPLSSGREQSARDATGAGSPRRGRAGIGARNLSVAARSAGATARRRLIALRSLFFQVYPLLRASYEGSCLVYQWLYLFRRTAFYSPALRLTGMVVRRATVEDWEEDQEEALAVSAAAAAAAAAENSALGSGTMNAGGGRSSGSSSSSLGERVAWYAKVLLVTAIVGFKIAEWWTRVESEAREIYYLPRAEGSSWRRGQLPPPPPPPQPPLPAPGGCGVPIDPAACPACGGLRVNPALCAVSGFVFCYLCLTRHVREHGECPVTGLTCREEDVVRLFDDEDRGGRGGSGA
ncbi:unnamed protein product [Ascophyllum nodosum]